MQGLRVSVSFVSLIADAGTAAIFLSWSTNRTLRSWVVAAV